MAEAAREEVCEFGPGALEREAAVVTEQALLEHARRGGPAPGRRRERQQPVGAVHDEPPEQLDAQRRAEGAPRRPAEDEGGVRRARGPLRLAAPRGGRGTTSAAGVLLPHLALDLGRPAHWRVLEDHALALGARGEAFDAAKLRYGRVVIMTDADVDGAHIRALLLTFFYRYRRELVSGGHVFVACPPLYKVGGGARPAYCWSEAELAALLLVCRLVYPLPYALDVDLACARALRRRPARPSHLDFHPARHRHLRGAARR